MIELIGWLGTSMILLGTLFNAREYHIRAMITWILGDIAWITYDIFINNFSHLTLSAVIIIINIYGIQRQWKSYTQKKKYKTESDN